MNQIPSNSPLKTIPYDYYRLGDESWFKIKQGLDKGKLMFYSDSYIRSQNTSKTVLFIHGNPECSYTYRKVRKFLIDISEEPFRMVSIDHIGFGLSDQATYQMVCMDHARNLLQLIKKLNLQNVTLIVHDWGGPIGIGAFLKEPERVSNLIILNTTVFPIPITGITFRNYPINWLGWCYTPYIIPDNFWGSFAAYAIFTSPSKPIPLLSNMIKNFGLMKCGIFQESYREAQRIFMEQFNSKYNIKSSKRLVKQTKLWGHGNSYRDPILGKRNTKNFYKNIHENLRKFWGPSGKNIGVGGVLGKWDPLSKDSVIQQWKKNLPQIKNNLTIFKNVGHFIEEIKPKIIASEIKKFAEL